MSPITEDFEKLSKHFCAFDTVWHSLFFKGSFSKYQLSINSVLRRFQNTEGQTRFCWTDSQQGLLKSSFFWGYLVLQIHGGTLAEKFGTRLVLGSALLLTSVLTVLTPVIAKWNVWALFTSRILIGIAESVTFPSLPPLVQR